MDMCYDGALVMPSSYAVMDEEEMMYLEGGSVITSYSTAKNASTYLMGKAGYYAALGAGGTLAATAALASVVGAVGAGSAAALCYSMASKYTSAYNSAESIRDTYGNSKMCVVKETLMFAIYVSNVTCKVA